MTTIRAMRRGNEPEASWDIFSFFCGVGFLCTAPLAHRFHAPSATEVVLLVAVGVAAMVGQITMNMALRWVAAPVHGITAQLAVVIASGIFGKQAMHFSLVPGDRVLRPHSQEAY